MIAMLGNPTQAYLIKFNHFNNTNLKETPMLPPKLIIFDCDGVLVDTEQLANGLIAQELSQNGLPMTKQEAMDLFVGGTMINVFETARTKGANIPDNWVDIFYEKLYAKLRQGVEPIKGIKHILDLLQQKNTAFCVASNGSEEKMEITLGNNGLMQYFQNAVFSAHTLGIAKPDPGLFSHAAKTMGFDPQDCVVIEDSVSGVKAAKAANMKCFGYCEESNPETLKAEDAIPFFDMHDLPKLLNL